MLSSYLLLTLRTLTKNKITFAINLLGMGIALGCCITAYVNFEFNNGFDKQQKHEKEVYRIAFTHDSEGKETHYGVAPIPVGNLIRENHLDVKVIQYISKSSSFRIGKEMFQKEFVYADPAFTKVFTLDPLYGSLDLSDKSNVLISDQLAVTYFGKKEVIGLPLTQIIDGLPREFTVSGVYKSFPFNSSFRFDLLTTFENYFTDPAKRSDVLNDWKKWSTTFLHITDPGAVKRVTEQLRQYVKTQQDARPDLMVKEFYVEPFIGMAARAVRTRNQGHWLNMPMPPAAVVAPFAMAGLLLLVACFNVTNHAISIAGRRLKEIGIRKVMGGNRKELIFQFMSESFVFSMLALFIALFLAEFFVAGWSAMWPGIQLTISYANNIQLFIALGVLVIVTTMLSGSYPAFYISSFRPIHVLKGTTTFGGTNLFTKILLVFQLSISLMAVIFAIAFYYNSNYQKSYDLGYAYHSVVQVPVENENQFVQLSNELSKNRIIQAVGGSEHHVYASVYQASVKYEHHAEKAVDALNVGDDYFNVLNIRMVAGRAFNRENASDRTQGVIVNQEFVKEFGLGENPLGKRLLLNDTTQVYIVGVVKDVYLQALFKPLAPALFRNVEPSSYRYLVAAADPEFLVDANREIKTAWQKLFPNSVYNGKLMEERMVEVTTHFDNVVILYTFLGAVVIVLSVSGLFSLVSLNLQKRTRELGIRKVLGASLRSISFQASKLFVLILIISSVIGCLAGSLLVNAMMNSIWEYYEAINSQVLSLAVTILCSIAALTLAAKIYSVTTANPSEVLRHE